MWNFDVVSLICFGTFPQTSLLTQMPGWEQGESELCQSSVQETQIQRKPETCQRKAYQTIP